MVGSIHSRSINKFAMSKIDVDEVVLIISDKPCTGVLRTRLAHQITLLHGCNVVEYVTIVPEYFFEKIV